MKKGLRRKGWIGIILLFGIVSFIRIVPHPVFETPYSFVLLDSDNRLLGAKIAQDGQWRFPRNGQLPSKYEKALLHFEDRRFHRHLGVSIRGISRAFLNNIRGGARQGGSTLNMQIARLSRKAAKRNYFQKTMEMIFALSLDLQYSKEEILNLYASQAPYGGNIVGIDAACWKYYQKDVFDLSWAESALMAVLPNAPSLINLSQSRVALLEKRNRLLHSMMKHDLIDSTDYQLALLEELPQSPKPFPSIAYHLLHNLRMDMDPKSPQIAHSTIHRSLQNQIQDRLNLHIDNLRTNDIKNAAVLVIHNPTKTVKAYVGNVEVDRKNFQSKVDLIRANRSTGSILKPLLFAKSIDEGLISPQSLLMDSPVSFGDYSPKNFYEDYDGVVPAQEALYRSLNIPFVHLLQDYGQAKFLDELKALRLTGITKDIDHYGLSLILGGAETSLWDITNAYASMARSLLFYTQRNSQYDSQDYIPARVQKSSNSVEKNLSFDYSHFSAASIFLTFESMTQLNRPDYYNYWKSFSSRHKIAWKTGTSFGLKDAWAIGLTPEYTVGVWVGNADGEGRAELIGLKAAAPLLFNVFDILGTNSWFTSPEDALQSRLLCSESGYTASPQCPTNYQKLPIATNTLLPMCDYHEQIHLDSTQQYQVRKDCYQGSIVSKPIFQLDPLPAYYFQRKHPEYSEKPGFLPGCSIENGWMKTMQFERPLHHNTHIQIPKTMDGTISKYIVKIAHTDPNAVVYWYVNGTYSGQTERFHELSISAKAGKTSIRAIDDKGNEERASCVFYLKK